MRGENLFAENDESQRLQQRVDRDVLDQISVGAGR